MALRRGGPSQPPDQAWPEAAPSRTGAWAAGAGRRVRGSEEGQRKGTDPTDPACPSGHKRCHRAFRRGSLAIALLGTHSSEIPHTGPVHVHGQLPVLHLPPSRLGQGQGRLPRQGSRPRSPFPSAAPVLGSEKILWAQAPKYRAGPGPPRETGQRGPRASRARPFKLTYLGPAGSNQELAGRLCVQGRGLEASFNTICKSRQQKELQSVTPRTPQG